MSERHCKRCARDIGARPPHHRYCGRCYEAVQAAEIGVPPSGWDEEDMLWIGNGWESDDY
jgi:hypothetical protein